MSLLLEEEAPEVGQASYPEACLLTYRSDPLLCLGELRLAARKFLRRLRGVDNAAAAAAAAGAAAAAAAAAGAAGAAGAGAAAAAVILRFHTDVHMRHHHESKDLRVC